MNNTVGQKLAIYRKSKGYTQNELAAVLGISQSALTDYERGRLRLNSDLIIKIVNVLKISSDELLGIKTSNKSDMPSLRLMKRFHEIEKLPEARKKAIIRIIDDLLFASDHK